MKDWLKNWKTNLVGILMIAAAGYRFYSTGEVNWGELVVGLTGIGFLVNKDWDVSGTKP